MSRIYKVKTPDGTERLIKAKSKGAAINWCVAGDYSADVVGASDLYEWMQAGGKVEDAAAEIAKETKAAVNEAEAPKAVNVAPINTNPAFIPPAPATAHSINQAAPAMPSNPVLDEQKKINPEAAQAALTPQEAPTTPTGPVDWGARERSSQ